ncbi:hypothetical protein [Cecembia sp.]|uniref:hypothetical protein n=1 Tax=Cecembia sp. TaxID=1898110 RepID=UPI0025BAB526|nr:hypothetical protein [Cecembia sp.]
MRVVREFSIKEVRVSVFNWNNKYLIKFELGPLEQTFKVSEMDILEESDLDKFYEGHFFDEVLLRFKEMEQSLYNQIQNL